VPVAAAETCADFRNEVDEVFCAETPETFVAVGQFYDDFAQTAEGGGSRAARARAKTAKRAAAYLLSKGGLRRSRPDPLAHAVECRALASRRKTCIAARDPFSRRYSLGTTESSTASVQVKST
jgi:hypothetical protein